MTTEVSQLGTPRTNPAMACFLDNDGYIFKYVLRAEAILLYDRCVSFYQRATSPNSSYPWIVDKGKLDVVRTLQMLINSKPTVPISVLAASRKATISTQFKRRHKLLPTLHFSSRVSTRKRYLGIPKGRLGLSFSSARSKM